MSRTPRIFVAAALTLGVLGATSSALKGTFALQTGAAKTQAFMRAEAAGSDPLVRRIDMWMTPGNGSRPIRAYSVDMTQLLHVIIVSDDFKIFLHVHPMLGADGHFRITQHFPAASLYHVYADGEPQGAGQQVFRFDLPVGAGASRRRLLDATGRTVAAGPYSVSIGATTLRAGRETALAVHVRRGGKPASDLHPYLGVPAHAVFLGGGDLTYVHVHPMPAGAIPDMPDMPGMENMDMKPLPDSATSAPDMLLHVAIREPGTYKLWLQFRGGKALYVAPFVLTLK
ncbi:MAG TPA: hypothetical protein VN603_11770 [Candidatus Acidoferrales bacterium]|nr:hypothetical protein [Candidatus Acidoferrales bacterium]